MRKIPLIGKNRAFSYKIRYLCLRFVSIYALEKNQKLEIKRQFFSVVFYPKECIYFLYSWGENMIFK